MQPNISAHITYAEATRSEMAIRHGLDNTPNSSILVNMRLVAENIFEPIRMHFGVKLGVTSFFRSPEVNKVVGGARFSQHCTGQAIDIDGDGSGIRNSDILGWVLDNLNFDQMIWEFGGVQPAWVHVSYKPTGNRKQVLRALKLNGKTVYVPYS